ncbi:hypothetical protein GCM10010109_18350 [Actinoplanes campanulatus]|nr:hypothetical protein GCM10010109_18350 [Actinoplanes campanulatus]GID36353.1 hypothetical protein Aca09nite_28590 [Actinoplanes campanulatus]
MELTADLGGLPTVFGGQQPKITVIPKARGAKEPAGSTRLAHPADLGRLATANGGRASKIAAERGPAAGEVGGQSSSGAWWSRFWMPRFQ